MAIQPIDNLPSFTQHLGKARTDRLRYARCANTRKLSNATNLTNTVIRPMQWYSVSKSGPVNDVITGIARLDHEVNDQKRTTSLSVSRLYNVFQCIEVINTREVMAMMNIEKRQAQRYVRASKLILPQLERMLLKQ